MERSADQLAPKEAFLVVHPSDPDGTWDLVRDPPILADFMQRMITAFHVDEKRVHFTGFSMGSAMTFWFLCNHREILASAAPVTGSSAEQVRTVDGDMPCIPSIDADWKPRVPTLFMSGRLRIGARPFFATLLSAAALPLGSLHPESAEVPHENNTCPDRGRMLSLAVSFGHGSAGIRSELSPRRCIGAAIRVR